MNQSTNITKETTFPSNTDIEAAVIGALLLETAAWARVGHRLKEEVFYNTRHRLIFSAMQQLMEHDRKIDILTVTEELRRMDALEEAGGAFHVAQLSAMVASSAHLEEHAQIVLEMFLRRELILLGVKIQQMAYDRTQDLMDTITTASAGLDAVMSGTGFRDTGHSMEQLVPQTLQLMQQRMEAGSQGLVGIDTGLEDLNLLLGGWRESELVVMAARPSIGKTALMLHFAHAAATTGRHVMVFSAEMSGVSLTERYFLRLSEADPAALRSGKLTKEEYDALDKKARKELAPLPLLIDDEPGMSLMHIRNVARMHRLNEGCDLILIDYLQLTDMTCFKVKNREQEVSMASRMAKQLAREAECPVILLCQLNRKVEERMVLKSKPLLSDLRESGAIEQDADVVLLLDRPATRGLKNDPDRDYPTDDLGIIYVAKNRNGATGNVYFKHDRTLMRLEKYVPTEELLQESAPHTIYGLAPGAKKLTPITPFPSQGALFGEEEQGDTKKGDLLW